jgi:carboxypeptidase Taq
VEAYRALEQRFARLSAVHDAIRILGWDQETMMPLGAAEGRSEQLASVEVIAHELLTAAEVDELLDRAEQDARELDDGQRANLREMRRIQTHATAVPADLVEARSKAVSRCEIAWRRARAESDFPSLLPLLSEVLIFERQVGQAKGDVLGLSPYDALLDSHDPGARQADIDPLFAVLKAELPDLLREALECQRERPPPPPMEGPFPVEVQRGIGQRLMTVVGFDLGRGRLDVSAHPFCGGAIDDVRITTRYDEADFSSGLMGILHESGHGLYEQGRPRQWLRQPVGRARGMSMHESQSLLIEMQACRSRAFAEYLAPLVREAFGASAASWDADALYRHATRVRPGFIRVDADEITYPAHILVRYELEKALISGEMALGDLPAAFNAGIRDMLGLNVPEDRLGCLQDIHWSGGAWVYFPTYTLGAMIAAQLFDAACEAEPDVMPGIARGDFAPLLGWLRANVHEQGSSLQTGEILTRATGRPLDAAVYRRHLADRYLAPS